MTQGYSVPAGANPALRAFLRAHRKEVASLCGVSERAVESWALGERRPRIESANRILRMARRKSVELTLADVLSA